jgi:basic membrane protein A
LRRSTKFAALITAGILSLAMTSCSSDSEGGTATDGASDSASSAPSDEATDGASEETTLDGSDIKVGMAYDVGGRGDQSFNDSAAKGLDKAMSEFGIESQESEATDGEAESDRETRLRTFADAGYTAVIAVGFAYSESIGKVAPDYPDVNFAIIDDSANELDNVGNLVFAEEQGSFLVGAAAALKSTTNHVGFIGGVETPLLQKFEAGFVAGAKAVKADVTVDTTYLSQPPDFSGFGDPAKGKTAAQGMYDAGADIVYAAAGGSGSGVFEAAAESDGKAIGVDSDQYLTADPAVQKVIITSMLKNVDVAVYNYIKGGVEGTWPTGVTTYDLSVDGVGYATSNPGAIDDITTQLDEFKQQIIDGEIKVPTTP